MRRPDWLREEAHWPHSEASRFVRAAGTRWHVQVLGDGPALLMLHGTGASTHSWVPLVPFLTRDYSLVIPDLPGHGFTAPLPGGTMSLHAVSTGLTALLAELAIEPLAVIGHSAGAAIACRMALDGREAAPTISINGALSPLSGHLPSLPSWPLRSLVVNPLLPRVLSAHASRSTVEAMLLSTGSAIGEEQQRLYRRLFQYPGHVEGALAMMADWDLKTLRRDLRRLRSPLALLAGEKDRFIPPSASRELARDLPQATFRSLGSLGHLAHEEDASGVAAVLKETLAECAAEAGL